ncbi:unnamed protein product [Closterium sp. NIES-53]
MVLLCWATSHQRDSSLHAPPVFKARYVARGFSQRQGVDYFQTFSPTPKMTTLWGSLHEEIWLRRPPGFTGSFPPGTQWSLRRPVYGLRQAPRQWHDTLRTTLAALGFAPSTADPSLFLRTDTSLPPFYIIVYVDDLVFATADTAGLAHVKSELQKRHTCTDLGELRSCLGLNITRDRAQRTITLTQSHMVQQVLQRFDFTYSSPQATPLSTRHSLSALPSDESVEPSGPYPELVGCLMYLMTCTRPDLAYPLSILARYVAPGRHRPEHMAAAKRVLRYLCSTSGLGLVLGGQRPLALLCLTGLWLVQRAHRRSGAPGVGEPGDTGAGGAVVTTGAREPTEPGAAGARGAGAGVAGFGGPGAGGARAAGAGAIYPVAGGARGIVRQRPYFVPLLQQVLGVPSTTGLPPPFLSPPLDQAQPPLQPASPLHVPSCYTEQSGGLTERREPASRPVSPVHTAHCAPRSGPPPVPGTHTMALRPSSVPLRVPLPAPPESSLPEVPDPESERGHAACPTVTRLLATAVTDPSFEYAAASALVAELLAFAAACRLNYASALVAESVPASPPSVWGECALGTDVLEDRQEDFEWFAATVPRFASLLLAPEGDPDAPHIPTPRSYAEATTGPYSSEW